MLINEEILKNDILFSFPYELKFRNKKEKDKLAGLFNLSGD